MSAVTDAPQRNTPTDLRTLVRQLDWRQELLGAVIVSAEATLVYLLTGFALEGRAPGYAPLPAWIVALLLLTAHFTPHLLDEWRVWSPRYEAILGGAIGVTLLMALKWGSFPGIALWDPEWLRQLAHALAFLPNHAERPVWGIVVLAAYAWWRGRTRAEPSLDSAYTLLRGGSLALAVLLVLDLAAAPDHAPIRGQLSGGTLLFFIFTLGAIGVARLKLEGFRSSAPLGPRWLATFVAPILAVAVVAVLAAGIFSRSFLDTVLWLLTPVILFIQVTVQLIVIILAIIAFLFITPLLWIIGSHKGQPVQPAQPPNTGNNLDKLQQRAGDAIHVPDPLRYLIVAIVLFVICSLLVRFAFRRRRRARESTDEQRESVLDWSDVFGSLKNQITGLWQRPKPIDPLAHLRGDPRWQHTLTIREAYLRLQTRGAKAGRPRRDAETADEYRPQVSSRLATPADVPAAVGELTEVYRRARYTGAPADAADAARATAAWERIARAPDGAGH